MAKFRDRDCSLTTGISNETVDENVFNQNWSINKVKEKIAYFIDEKKCSFNPTIETQQRTRF